MSKEAMKLAEDALKRVRTQDMELVQLSMIALAAIREALASEAKEQPAPVAKPRKQEPVAVPTTSYEHRKFVLVGRDWYERFAAFHDDCQIGEQLTWQEKTIRQQGYENGWNDAQRYLKEPQSTSPTPAQQEPVAWLDPWTRNNVTTDYDAYGKHGIPLYTSPQAQRTWAGLTDEQWQSIADTLGCFITRGQKDAIEATIGIKGDA